MGLPCSLVRRGFGRKYEKVRAGRSFFCAAEGFLVVFARQTTGNLAVSKKLHKTFKSSLTPRKLAPITPTSNGAARLLLAAEALVQMSGLKRDRFDIQDQVFSALLVGCLSQGLTGLLGLGGRDLFRLFFDIVG